MFFYGMEGMVNRVCDPVTQIIIIVVDDTASHSANGASMALEFDLGISNNEDETYAPFKFSTLAEGASGRIDFSTNTA